MSHCIEYAEFDIKTAKGDMLSHIQSRADRDGDCEGQISKIRWLDKKTYINYDEAYAATRKLDNGRYDCLGVKFYEYPEFKSSKKLDNIKERLAGMYDKLRVLENTPYASTFTNTQYIGCKSCGSKINTKFLKGNYCPVCHQDMRPLTTLNKMKNLRKRIYDLQDVESVETVRLQEKQLKKAKVRWLVKYEYHC